MSPKSNDGLSRLFKGPSNETLIKIAQQTSHYAESYAMSLAAELKIPAGTRRERINMGPIKKPDAADRKTISQYDGDRRKLDDMCRLQLLTNGPKEMERILRIFGSSGMVSNNFHKNMFSRSGYQHLEAPRDYISKAKRWGWMGVQLKVKTPLNKGKTGKFEVQIFDQGMKDAYDKTHGLYEEIRTSLETWEASNKELHKVLTAQEFKVAQEILRTHRDAAEKCGLINLCTSPFPELNDPQPLIVEENILPLEPFNKPENQITNKPDPI